MHQSYPVCQYQLTSLFCTGRPEVAKRAHSQAPRVQKKEVHRHRSLLRPLEHYRPIQHLRRHPWRGKHIHGQTGRHQIVEERLLREQLRSEKQKQPRTCEQRPWRHPSVQFGRAYTQAAAQTLPLLRSVGSTTTTTTCSSGTGVE